MNKYQTPLKWLIEESDRIEARLAKLEAHIAVQDEKIKTLEVTKANRAGRKATSGPSLG